MFNTTHSKKTLWAKSGIYKITLRGTNRHYIGRSVNLWSRLRAHVYCVESQPTKHAAIHRAVKEFGFKAFDYSVLAFCDPGALSALEDHFIKEFDCLKKGFNKCKSGQDYLNMECSEETRRKISEANKGKKRTPEAIKRSSDARKGRVTTKEHCAKLSAALKGRKKSPEHVAKVKAIHTLNLGKPVHQYSKEGEFIASFPSTQEAARRTGSTQSNMWKALNGRMDTHNGFIWKYAPAVLN